MTAAPKEFSASGMAVRTAAILFVFVIIFTGLLSGHSLKHLLASLAAVPVIRALRPNHNAP